MAEEDMMGYDRNEISKNGAIISQNTISSQN